MIKATKLLISLTIISLFSSFTDKNLARYIGTYGVSASDPAQIKLIIRSDNSFYYQDFSRQQEKIVVNGNWTRKGKKIILSAQGSAKKFHKIWTFKENGSVVKSRKGITFYSLTKQTD